MTFRTKMMAFLAASALGTSGGFAQASSPGETQMAVTEPRAGTDPSNQGSAAVAPGTGLPPGAEIPAKRAAKAEDRSSSIPQKPQEHRYSPSSEPSFLFMLP